MLHPDRRKAEREDRRVELKVIACLSMSWYSGLRSSALALRRHCFGRRRHILCNGHHSKGCGHRLTAERPYFFRLKSDPHATAAKIKPAPLSASMRIASNGMPKSSCATLPVSIAAIAAVVTAMMRKATLPMSLAE
jgi:hypothetical protein